VPVEVSIGLVRDDAGNPSHVQSIVRDISKRKRTERILQMLNNASLSMRKALTPNGVFEAAGPELKNLGFDYTVFSVDDTLYEATARYYSFDSKTISMAAKLLGVNPKDYKLKVDEIEVIRQAVQEQKTVFISDSTAAIHQLMPGRLGRVLGPVIRVLNVPRAINAPLVVNDRVIGMLSVQSPELTEDDVPLITAFALQMAAAWHKARLLQDLEQNLADLRRTEESLRESEEKYHSLFDLSPEAILLVGLNGIILDANQAAARFWKIDKQEIIGRSFLDVGSLAEEQTQYFLDFFAGAISGDIQEYQEMQFVFGEDEQRWAEVYPALLKKGDETLALQLIIRDVTERKAAEQAIRRRLAELEAIYLLSVQLASASLRVREITEIAVRQLINIMHVDRCTFSLYDAKTDELKTVASMWFDGEIPTFAPDVETTQINDYPATKRVLETMRPQVFQVRDPNVNSAERTCMQNKGTATLLVVPLAVQDQAIGILKLETRTERQYTTSELNLAITLGNLAAVALENARLYETAQQELSDRIQAETALQKSEEQFRSIFENAVMGLYRSTPGGRVLMANPAMIQMLGYETMEQLAALDATRDLYCEATEREKFISLIEKTGQVKNLEAAWKKRDGSILYVRESAKAICDDRGRTMYYEGTVEDITTHKIIEQERKTLIEFQQVVTELSARFINLATSEIEPAIGQALHVVSKYTNADAASVWLFDVKNQTGSKVFGWPTNEKRATNQDVPFGKYPWVFETIIKGESLMLPGWDNAPYQEREAFLASYSMRAILAVPLIREGKVFGALSVYTRTREKTWTNDLENLLRIVGDIIVNALERKQAEESIRKFNEELEQRVIQRTQQLEAANQELEAFAYSVSHDLRAPLRAIDGFSLALIEDYSSQLDEGAISYLDRVRAASQRMGQLIDDLLKLSRVTRSEMVHHTVNLSALVDEIADELQGTEPMRNVTFHIQPGVTARGDQQLLRVMLTNLLNNAWKFTSKKEQSVIEFGRLDDNPDVPIYFVRDNGVGFNMDYADKLFGTFQRLHSTHEFEGTGIGLATVKRIVLRHGGRVWAEGDVDHGATFYFTLGEQL
jgi:PAS domain S-box-containing protein